MNATEFGRWTLRAAVVAVAAVAANGGVGVAEARITSIQITSTTTAFNGTSFGSVGPYENVIGVAHGELDPDDPLNAVITDIDLAPRNGRGAVEYSFSGVMAEPPVTGQAYALLVPAVDSDGNDTGGLRNVNVQVPLGTYTGWNPRKAGFSEGDSCDLTGGYIPFFRTKAQRDAAFDPRPSLAERYPTHADYVTKVTAAANSLVAQRVLLPQDAALMIQQANMAVVP